MSSIMLGGSIGFKGLPQSVKIRMHELQERDVWFAVGDAKGSDLAFQELLAQTGYKKVVVFTSLPQPRHNLANWRAQLVDSGLRSRGADMHTAKDRKMVAGTESGFLLWDLQSIGTLANILDFIEQGKSCLLWTPSDVLTWELDSPQSLEKFLLKYPQAKEQAVKRLEKFKKREQRSAQGIRELDEPGLF